MKIMAANPTMLPSPQDIDGIESAGLVRQVYAFNRERVVISSAEAMAEVLINRTYEFPKPKTVQNILIPFLGRGLITVEGDEHKVCFVTAPVAILNYCCFVFLLIKNIVHRFRNSDATFLPLLPSGTLRSYIPFFFQRVASYAASL